VAGCVKGQKEWHFEGFAGCAVVYMLRRYWLWW